MVVIYTVESRVDTAIRAVGNDGKRSGEVGDGRELVRKLAGLEESIRVTVTVDPGAGEGENVGVTRLVIVDGRLLLTRVEGDGFGETELVIVGSELLTRVEGDGFGETELVTVGSKLLTRLEGDGLGETELMIVDGRSPTRLEDDRFGGTELLSGGRERLVSGRDELGSTVNELGVNEGGNVEGGEGVEEGTDVEDVRERSDPVVTVGKGVDVIVKLVKERSGGEEEGSELGSVMEEGEDGILELDGETVRLGLKGRDKGEMLGRLVVEIEEDEDIELEKLKDVELVELVEDVELEPLEGVELEVLLEDEGLVEPVEDVRPKELDEDVELSGGSLEEKVLNGGDDVGLELVDRVSWDVRLGVPDVDGRS